VRFVLQDSLYTYRVSELSAHNIRVQLVTEERPVDARFARGFYVRAIATPGCNLNEIDALKFLKCMISIQKGFSYI
jgi:hypothetical protein